MNNLSQPPQPTEPDMALLYLGSLFETLDYTLPPERDDAKLDALAWHILDKRPKTLLGLAIRARAERHLCRYLWTVDFERLPPSDQAARVVIECATLLSSRPCDRGEFHAQSKTPPVDRGPTGFYARTTARDLALRRAMLPERRTGATLGDMQLRSDLLDADTAKRGAVKVARPDLA